MPKRLAVIAIAPTSLILTGCASSKSDPTYLVTEEQVLSLIRQEPPPYPAVTGVLQVADAGDMPYRFEVTNKGNGALEIGNLLLRIYDVHDDGNLYDPPLLRIACIERPDGKCFGLHLTGMQVFTDEVTGKETGRQPIDEQFVYDPNQCKWMIDGAADERIVLSTEWGS